jgi:hypothetical protein
MRGTETDFPGRNEVINFAHIDALLNGSSEKVSRVIDGVTYVAEGHFLVAYAGDLPTDGFEDKASIDAMWAKLQREFSANPDFPPLGDLILQEPWYFRKIGDVTLNEAYVRCFPGASFFPSTAGQSLATTPNSVGVVVDGRVIALVMGVKYSGDYEPILLPVSDGDVFACFAAHGNGFYLLTDQEIRRRLLDLQVELSSAREEKMSLEEEIGELEVEISELHVAIRARSSAASKAEPQ